MPLPGDTFTELGDRIDFRPGIGEHYERRIASKSRILDVGGQNQQSRSARRLRELGAAKSEIVTTDVLAHYCPDLVDDITATSIPAESFDGVNCVAILEHVKDYQAALHNIHAILTPGGEAFFYVPFMYRFHDAMDYHRFTVTEVARMLEAEAFSEIKVMAPLVGGYGWVLAHTLTYGQIEKKPTVLGAFTKVANGALALGARAAYRRRPRPDCTIDQFTYWAVSLNFNHGFFAWAKK